MKALALLLLSPAVFAGPLDALTESSGPASAAPPYAGAASTTAAPAGRADALAAEAESEFTLGAPMNLVISEYARAARLDPKYMARYQALVEQWNSRENPRAAAKTKGYAAGSGTNAVATALALAGVAGIVFIAILAFLGGRPLVPKGGPPPG